MDNKKTAIASKEARKRKQGRSPSYPAIDLGEAFEKVKVLRDTERMNFTNIDVILPHWGYGSKSSQGLLVLAALKKYGLLEDEGKGKDREAKVSDFAQDLILSDQSDYKRLIKESALKPTINNEIWGKYKGELPSDANLKRYLITSKNFTDYAADQFIKNFKRTIEFASLTSFDKIIEDTDNKNVEDDDKIPTSLETKPRLEVKQTTENNSGISQNLQLAADAWAKIEATRQLSEDEWNRLIAILDILKPSFVTETKIKPDDSTE